MKRILIQRVEQIREICTREKLQIADIADLVSFSGEYVSLPTISKLLNDDLESANFQHHSVIAVYEALINKYGDMPDVQDIGTLKFMLAERDKQIDRVMMQLEHAAEEHGHRDVIYADRKNVFENTIQLLREQLVIKDKEIDRQATLIEKLVTKLTE